MKSKKLYVDDETYAAVAGYKSEMEALGASTNLSETTCNLIRTGLWVKRASMWDIPLAHEVRCVMREVAESDRYDREAELEEMLSRLEGMAIRIDAASYSMLLAAGLGDEEVARIRKRAEKIACAHIGQVPEGRPWI